MYFNYSLARKLEYQELSTVSIHGNDVLDIGGDKDGGYLKILTIKNPHIKIFIANIDPNCHPDLILDAEKPNWPFKNDQFDCAIAFNLLEHLYNFKNTIQETARVLKSGGQFIVATPFMYMIHASPSDYFRYTPAAFERMLADAGFEITYQKFLGHQLFCLVYQLVAGKIRPAFLRRPLQAVCIFIDTSLSKLFSSYKKFGEKIPLGVFIVAIKK